MHLSKLVFVYNCVHNGIITLEYLENLSQKHHKVGSILVIRRLECP